MSYDLSVFVPDPLTGPALRDLISSVTGLGSDEQGSGSVAVVRGARRRYSFTVEGPLAVEAEDVPDAVSARVLGARCMYSILVEGTTESEIPHALRFARRLAQQLDGAVFDHQSEEIWSRSKSRTIQKPQRKERVAAVDLRWCCLSGELGDDIPGQFIAIAQRIFPEAIPRRFGGYEPLQGKYAEVGAEGFAQAWAAERLSFFFTASAPVTDGSLSEPPTTSPQRQFWSMSLTVLAEPLNEPRWRDALRELFIALADDLPAFYAQAEVKRGHIWSGRTLWSDNQTESGIHPARHREGWLGLPPRPMWWSWLGLQYREFVDLLPMERCTSTARGVLFEAAEAPAARDEIDGLARWLPSELFYDPEPVENGYQRRTRAVRIPEGLAANSDPEPEIPEDVLKAASEITCPRCDAEPHMPCRNADGAMNMFHSARLTADRTQGQKPQPDRPPASGKPSRSRRIWRRTGRESDH